MKTGERECGSGDPFMCGGKRIDAAMKEGPPGWLPRNHEIQGTPLPYLSLKLLGEKLFRWISKTLRRAPLILDVRRLRRRGAHRRRRRRELRRQGPTGISDNLHLGYFRGVANAAEIRDTILAHLKRLRSAGLGDPDEPAPEAVAAPGAGMTANRGIDLPFDTPNVGARRAANSDRHKTATAEAAK